MLCVTRYTLHIVMNIKILHSWLLEYLDTPISPYEIQKYVSLCGPSIERIEKVKDDYIYDIEITSNRIDTVSIRGLAREIAAILKRFSITAKCKKPAPFIPPPPVHQLPFFLSDEKKLCRRLMAVIMDNVTVKKSPKYVTTRLESAGIRSINNLVDITNYVMLETGHPTHIFDYDRIKTNKFFIRYAKKEERIVTLDGKNYTLSEQDIIIDDGTGRVIDLPGIMGTENSVVTDSTQRIIFFIESNDPQSIRRSSMVHGIRTMAASINEKGPDPNLVVEALHRGIELYQTLASARMASEIFDVYPDPIQEKKIKISISYIHKKIGVLIPKEIIISILTDLEFVVVSDNDTLLVTVPSFRHSDVNAEEDIIEEIARIYGYHNITGQLPPLTYIQQPKATEHFFDYQHLVKIFLKHNLFHEMMNYSAYSEKLLKAFNLNPELHLQITNTISEEIKYLRLSLIPSLLKNALDNHGHSSNLHFFEIAKTYTPVKNDLPKEVFQLSLITKKTFFELKGLVEALLKDLFISAYSFKPSHHPYFSDHLQAELVMNGKPVGAFGKLKQTILDSFELTDQFFAAEFDFEYLISHAKLMPVYVPFHPYATIHLDLTIPLTMQYDQIVQKAKSAAPHLNAVSLKSLYKENVTLHFTFSSSTRNYTEKEAIQELECIKTILLKNDIPVQT